MRHAALLLALAATAVCASDPPVIVGAAVPLSGSYADLAAEYGNALVLWRDEVNAAGGLLGRPVELRLVDDRSQARASHEIYRQLIEAEGAQLLVGPYGSAATLTAATVAERARRVLLNATGAGRAAQRGYRYVFQVAAPYARYGDPVLELARAENLRSLFILARNDPPSREPAERLRQLALGLGLRVSDVQLYAAGTSDFSALAERARSDGAQAWIAFGTAREAAEMVKTFRRLGYAPPLFVAQGASQPGFIQALGQDAEHALGISPYEARLATLNNAEFVHAYRSRWGAVPRLAAAQGYAAGKLIEAAAVRAGSFDQERLRAALAALDTETPLGRYKADPATGAQIAAKPVLTQILEGRIEIVWPIEHATARRQLPYPSWDSRKLMEPALQ